jgi:hypothetical protein
MLHQAGCHRKIKLTTEKCGPVACDCFPGLTASRRHVLFAIASAFLPAFALAQERLVFDVKSSCNFYPGDKITDPIYNFQSSYEALDIVKRITHAVGLEPNFELLQANIPNAAAVIHDQRRYILYSLVFIEQIRKATATEWASLTILAHEIGHHLNGHTLSATGSRPTLELQADTFAGHAVKRIGGSLDQALAAYQMMSAEGTDTHPPRSARLEAVTRGWTEASVPVGPALPENPSTSGSVKDIDALAREIIESARLGTPPYSRMSTSLATTMKEEANASFAKLRTAGSASTITQQGKHLSADGNLYYFYDVSSGAEKLSCMIGLGKDGTLNVFHCQ